MGDAYQFSESSLPLLNQCIRVASQPGLEWMSIFESKTTLEKSKILKREESVSSNASTQIIAYEDNATDEQMEDVSKQATEEEVENIRATLEMEPQLDYLITECDKYDNVLSVLARKLSTTCVEAICSELFNSRPNYIEKMYVEFLAAFLQRDSAFDRLELLIRARNAHSEAFKSLIVAILTNKTPILVPANFFTTIDNIECSNLLQALSTTQISPEAFIEHLNPISYLYKSSQKTPEVQNFILNCLISSAKKCTKDKNYGKFLLSYIEALKESSAPINKQELEKLVKVHETTFVRPCLAILNKYK